MKRTKKEAQTETFVRIKKIDDEKKVVYGEVYAPDVLDTYGDFMTRDDIAVMAHRFMELATMRQAIDTNHDEKSNGSYPIESFIARETDPDYTPGSWVLGVKIVDDEIWKAVKKGDLNGYSFQALVRKLSVVVSVESEPDVVGFTEAADGHSHMFFAFYDADGRIQRGVTSEDNGHRHTISAGTATDKVNGHAHRIILGDT